VRHLARRIEKGRQRLKIFASEEIAIITEWVSGAATKDMVTYHNQILEITLKLRGLTPQPFFLAIHLWIE
jgi:hypothetical protein